MTPAALVEHAAVSRAEVAALASANVLTDPIVLPGVWSLTVPGALVGLVVILTLMLATSRLYTKGQHDEIIHLHEKRNALQAKTIESHEGTIAAQAKQITDLVEANSVTASFFQRADFVIQNEGDANASQG